MAGLDKIQFDWKKNLFWIVLGAVLVIGVGVWFMMTPDTTDVRSQLDSKGNSLKDIAEKAKADGVKNLNHVTAAKEYGSKLDAQREDLLNQAKSKGLDTRDFDKAPAASLQFDGWLNEQRQRLAEAAKSANLQLPPDFDKMTFSDSPTNEADSNIRRHRADRIRYMTILDIVVNELTKSYGTVDIKKWQPEATASEDIKSGAVSALSLEKFIVSSQAETAERNKKAWEVAMRNAAGGTLRGPSRDAPTPAEMPFTSSAVDLVFVAHQSAVPGLLQGLEKNPHYAAVVTKVDFERYALNYPPITDKSLQNAGPNNPYINTYWQEAPVRVIVSMELYQFDKARADKLTAPPAPATPAKGAATPKRG